MEGLDFQRIKLKMDKLKEKDRGIYLNTKISNYELFDKLIGGR